MDNDFHQTHDIFALFKGLETKDMKKIPTIPSSLTNGHQTNGVVNGSDIHQDDADSQLKN